MSVESTLTARAYEYAAELRTTAVDLRARVEAWRLADGRHDADELPHIATVLEAVELMESVADSLERSTP